MKTVNRRRRPEVRDPDLLKTLFYMKDGVLMRDLPRFGRIISVKQGRPRKGQGGLMLNYVHVETLSLRADHVIVALLEGRWPDDVEHLDGNTLNDHPNNLKPSFGKRLPVGVKRMRGRYTASVWIPEGWQYVGIFDTVEGAVKARDRKAAEIDAEE